MLILKLLLIRLRKARENWSQVFPLTGQLWLDWVADEQKIAATEEEKSKVGGNKDVMICYVFLKGAQFAGVRRWRLPQC